MKIDEYVNRVLRKLWPEDAKGNRAVRFHSQNLNEDSKGRPKGLPWHGRAWLNTPAGESRIEWNLWGHFCGVGLREDGDSGGVMFHGAFPPVSVWLTLPLIPKKFREYSHRNFAEVTFNSESKCVHWQFGGDTMSWSSKTPKWKHGSFDVSKFLFGDRKYTEGEPEVHRVTVPMPEGGYEATVELREDRWERPRWPTLRIRRASVDVPLGIPHMGKGENSWDCGEDRLFGWDGPCASVEEAVAKTVQSALNRRRRYDGNINAQYMPPTQQKQGEDAKVRA